MFVLKFRRLFIFNNNTKLLCFIQNISIFIDNNLLKLSFYSKMVFFEVLDFYQTDLDMLLI